MAERDGRLEDEVEDLEEMDRPDRAIPLPKGDDEDDGVGPVTGVVP